jgi:ribosomal RNA-processing protein 17
MFAHLRPKKGHSAPPLKKRKRDYSIQEIKFDNEARAEYLTGFHKRKQARIKHAQDVAVEKEKQERIETRRRV